MNKHNIKEKANYCISCIKKPCSQGCPLNNDTAGFIKLIKEEKYKEAYELLCETTVLSSVCGRVCPHTKQCEGKCIRGIKGTSVEIGNLESFIGDLAIKNSWAIPKLDCTKKNKKIAIIGGGPAGLTCAAFLQKSGYQVTIFEKHNYLGGLLKHGIPEFRLPKYILNEVINKIISLGIEVKLNQELGNDITLEELEKKYDAIFLSFGANIPINMNIEGENIIGVYGGNELLEYNNHPDYKDKIVTINGGGNVAIDVARTANKLGAKKVIIIYRRSEKEMPAESKEIAEAKAEGIEILYQTNILKIIGNNKVEKLECIKTELIQIENEKRLSPVNIEGSNFILETDYFINAIGSKPEEKILKNLNIKLDNKNYIIINELNQTSNKKIFAGGDIAGCHQTVAFASRSGRNAATNIIKYLEGNK